MSGRSPPLLYCILILITMRRHQSYHNITTVIHSYEYSTTVDNSTIETYRNRGLGKLFLFLRFLCFCVCFSSRFFCFIFFSRLSVQISHITCTKKNAVEKKKQTKPLHYTVNTPSQNSTVVLYFRGRLPSPLPYCIYAFTFPSHSNTSGVLS